MCTFFAYVLPLFFLALLSFIILTREQNKPWLRLRSCLPPGSMGLPYLGETLQLYSQDPNLFFAKKQKRYGEIFKTNILGCPSVMLASPEASKFVLATHAHLFKPTYPKSKETLIGPSALFFHQGDYHTRIRKLVQTSLTPESIRALVPGIQSIASSTLESWHGGRIINTFTEMKKELRRNYSQVENGYNSFPNTLPWTPYKKALRARQRLTEIIRGIVNERKARRLEEKNLLGHLLNSTVNEALTQDQIVDNIIGVLFAAQDTTASVITWIIKYLHDNPKLLEDVKTEQKAIYEANNEGEKPLTWIQTRNMPYTHRVSHHQKYSYTDFRVVLESLRMASIISFTFREAVTDVLPLFRNIHHNPEFFKDPQIFDPAKFEVAPKPNTFMPFGSGVHACPGNELAKLEMFIVIHHLVTKFRWHVVGSQSGVQYSPFPVPFQGLPARFWREHVC
ncbi:hypothetical protein V2J09_017059 [Rumex salicifolius]